jgi:hypothetical protein
MRSTSGTELNSEERSLVRRWAIAVTSFYTAIAIALFAALAMSTADRTTVVATSASSQLLQEQGSQTNRRLPYGSLPNGISDCTAPQACKDRQTRQ